MRSVILIMDTLDEKSVAEAARRLNALAVPIVDRMTYDPKRDVVIHIEADRDHLPPTFNIKKPPRYDRR